MQKGGFICANCDIASVLDIDMLGRVAHIGNQKVILSLCCASLIYYKGAGCEFSQQCGPQCVRENQFSKGRTVFQQDPSKTLAACFVCSQKNTAHAFQLLHAPTRTLRLYYLCSKHGLSPEIIETLGDELDLLQALRCNRRLA
jgi:hypothetical protein